MESSDEEEGRTFVQVVSEKYNPENFPYCRGNGMGVVVLSSPQGSPIKGQGANDHVVSNCFLKEGQRSY
uniref:Tubulin-specific chaperone cofactor E-like protein n=1 Tax=Esox lucius TaxID=8010 RepID=C1BXT9_ESOLU|nr:Tubulin-specific chaperone cofactor E-like protein [Esox lucius]